MEHYKFRAKSDGKWVYGSHVKTGVGLHYIIPQNLISNDIMQFKVNKDTVGQFTGLKDKNDKEIYEGDIVCDQYANFYTPIFRNGIYMAYNVEYLNLTKQEPSTQFNVVWNNGCEIIGNIYDSPELIAK